MFRLTILLTFIFSSALATASQKQPPGEGLHLSNPPEAIQSAWQSTYVIGANTFTASAFAISKFSVGQKHYAVFISGDHVYQDLLIERARTRSTGQLFSGVTFAKNIEFTPRPRNKKFSGVINGPYVDGIHDPAVDGWMFAVEVEAQWSAPLLSFSENCQYDIGDENYLVGFPSVPLRPKHVQKVKIEKPGTITKRWSSGVFVDSPFNRGPFIGTSADSLPGNSGCPVLNKKGKVIGALVTGNQLASITGQYQQDYQGVVSRCQALKDFKERSLKALIEKISL